LAYQRQEGDEAHAAAVSLVCGTSESIQRTRQAEQRAVLPRLEHRAVLLEMQSMQGRDDRGRVDQVLCKCRVAALRRCEGWAAPVVDVPMTERRRNMKRKVVYLRWKTPACEVIDQLNDLLADHGLEFVNLEEKGSIDFALVVRKK
jgi:hypothetical protein